MCRRTKAIDAIAAYCQFKQGIIYRLPQNKRVKSHIAESGYVEDQEPESEINKVQTKSASPLEDAIRSVTKDHRPLFCFIYIGQQNLTLKKRVQQFSSHRDVSKHIKRKHL
jgi:MinD-like ATPase involved in chromosome partitioning or flagellar assembly